MTMQQPDLCCSACGSQELERLISRVHHLMGEEDRMERLLDPSALAGVDENDPRSIARWARKMGKGLGEEAGEDFGELIDEMEETAAREMEEGGAGETDDESSSLD
jgi:hypothetical protein